MIASGEHPAVVVGAGPAGSVTAAALARAGHPVLLLEAAVFPRDKVCGDVILPEIEALLPRIGTRVEAIAHDAHLLDRCGYLRDDTRAVGSFHDDAGVVRPWRILPRKKLDERLARHAAACGADLREGHRLLSLRRETPSGPSVLEVQTPDGPRTFRAALVVGADGATSQVARDAGIRPGPADGTADTCVAMRTYIPWRRDDTQLTLVTDRDLLPGCCWVVPQGNGLANVGIGMIERDRRSRNIKLGERFHALMADRLGLETALPLRGWQLPCGSAKRRAAADGTLLVGDAAGLIDPFTGHGIHTAMRSALVAAGVADRALRGRRTDLVGPLGSYEKLWRDELLTEFRYGKFLQRFHARPSLAGFALGRAGVNRQWADRLMGLMSHALPRSAILRPGLVLSMLRRGRGHA